MEWVSPTGGGTQQPVTGAANVYSYPAFPGTKYSWEVSPVRALQTPAGSFINAGTLTVAAKMNTAFYNSATSPLIQVQGGSSRSINVYCTTSATGVFSLFMDTVLVGTFTLIVANWYYVALVYDISTVNWTADLYIDGALVLSGVSVEPSGETTGFYEVGGCGQNALFAQIISYDANTATPTAVAPIFCSRLAPNADTAEVGAWTPSVGATNVGVTAGDPFDNTTFTQEATPSSGDNVETEVDNLVAQLGLTAGTVLGATNHTYSSGTGVQAFASCRDSGGAYVDGSTITPDASDTTYAFATATVGLTGTSTIDCKYEIV
jgi:hypothetical protein